jgi:hypothetical protein
MSLVQSLHALARSRRALVLTPLIIALSALLIWTLEHADIVAFAITLLAGVGLVSGTFWVTGGGQKVATFISRMSRPAGKLPSRAEAADCDQYRQAAGFASIAAAMSWLGRHHRRNAPVSISRSDNRANS